ncbi:MAG: ABC transporter ATP-binding protein [Desulfobacula sp.]|jgi:spermidine/putrescine transport system ATP-binding protein|uniref:ABC transporter ATP-binding protein n=1 Tax=Desulfobacula sp. TaxID=2593537 RepID=UPI001D97F301|nr:ABC transporter ATP-binding protein [Desulfobacula sp.]MBT7087269.1 ABC transporter ATP-binding protein [Desulfobacterales bacterium]MBT4874775.1 ABC transporter ATP-binding protein [Desulfobacula sp.]MBT5547103.1 ABC transporter ATP-binding protein [Desulfobacula sp.]MBT6750872.1 ABC transporter ATP-binding protein [Desulfobacula sp.]
MQLALSVKNVTKKFGNYTAVDQVSFDVEDGKFFSILGPSGCGKTTLLRMIAGFYEPTLGDIEIRGESVIGLEPNKRPVNLIFQHLALFPMMNVKENIVFGLRRRGEKGKTVDGKVLEMLERVGLPGYEKHEISQLSGGQKQRVAIARSLVLEPSVLLLDEPLGALDLKLREHMKIELKELQAQVGTTFVYITHDQSEALVMSDHVAIMKDGRFEQIDSPQNLYHNPASSFVAQFVGNNNKFTGTLLKESNNLPMIQLEDDIKLRVAKAEQLEHQEKVELFIRPEVMIINPETGLDELNILDVKFKSILFDGGNSRLIVTYGRSNNEIIVSLPLNNRYDHLKPGDTIKIGWNPEGSACFKDTGIKTYDEL